MWSLTPVPSNSGDITLTCDIAGTYFVQCSISTQHTGADDDTMFGLTMQRNAPTNANERSDVIREDSSDSTLFLNRRAMLYNDKETVFSASDTLQIWALSNDTPGEDITILAIQIMIWRV